MNLARVLEVALARGLAEEAGDRLGRWKQFGLPGATRTRASARRFNLLIEADPRLRSRAT